MLRTILVASLAALLGACGSPEAATPQAALDAGGGRTVDNPFRDSGPATEDAVSADLSAAADNMTAVDGATDPDPAPETSAPAAIQPAVSQASSTSSCDDGKRVCRDMDSCEDAVFHLEQCGMSRLDGDSDGTPCESICGH